MDIGQRCTQEKLSKKGNASKSQVTTSLEIRFFICLLRSVLGISRDFPDCLKSFTFEIMAQSLKGFYAIMLKKYNYNCLKYNTYPFMEENIINIGQLKRT